jgi:hypothetical protein
LVLFLDGLKKLHLQVGEHLHLPRGGDDPWIQLGFHRLLRRSEEGDQHQDCQQPLKERNWHFEHFSFDNGFDSNQEKAVQVLDGFLANAMKVYWNVPPRVWSQPPPRLFSQFI